MSIRMLIYVRWNVEHPYKHFNRTPTDIYIYNLYIYINNYLYIIILYNSVDSCMPPRGSLDRGSNQLLDFAKSWSYRRSLGPWKSGLPTSVSCRWDQLHFPAAAGSTPDHPPWMTQNISHLKSGRYIALPTQQIIDVYCLKMGCLYIPKLQISFRKNWQIIKKQLEHWSTQFLRSSQITVLSAQKAALRVAGFPPSAAYRRGLQPLESLSLTWVKPFWYRKLAKNLAAKVTLPHRNWLSKPWIVGLHSHVSTWVW